MKEFLLDLVMTVKFAPQLLVADSLSQQWHLKRELLKQLLLLPPTNVSSITCVLSLLMWYHLALRFSLRVQFKIAFLPPVYEGTPI